MILWVHCSEPFKSLLTAGGLDNGILCIPIPLVIINMMPWKCSLKWMDSWMRLITWLDWYLLVESTLEWQASAWKQGGCDLCDVWQREASDLQNFGDLLQGFCHLIQKEMSRPDQIIFANIQRIFSSSFGSRMLRLGWTQHSGGAWPGPVLLLPSAWAHTRLWAEIQKPNYKHGCFREDQQAGLGKI